MITHLHCSHSISQNPMGEKVRMHTHNFHEIFYFISGDADYIIEGNVYRLQKGDLLAIRKSEAHRVVIKSDKPYERIVIQFDITDNDELLKPFYDKPLGKNNMYKTHSMPDNVWYDLLEKLCEYKHSDKCKYYLYPLLNELCENEHARTEGTPDRARQIIKYINSNLENELSLDKICNKFYISKPHLNRIFKKSTGTTVWSYITVKRLFFARDLIAGGYKPTEAYQAAGFSDYTAFYKAYKNQFGESPKKIKNPKAQ